MGYKSLRDFAAEKAVSMRAIQKHVSNHESELQGHIVRYGAPRGTYLDDYAQDYINGLLVGHPIASADQALLAENERIKSELDELKSRVIQLLEDKTILTERALEAEKVKALAEATAQEAGDKISNLEAALRDAETRAERAEAETQALKKRSLWQRITRFGE